MKYISLLVILLFLNSCKTDVQNTDSINKPFATIEFQNEINGYHVTAYWIISEYEDDQYNPNLFYGPAILKFENSKNQTFYINHPEFAVEISEINRENIILDKNGLIKSVTPFNEKIKYDNVVKFDDDKFHAPFIFKDVNFDNNEDLILAYARKWRNGIFNSVFINTGSEFESFVEAKEEPFNNIMNLYQIEYDFIGNYTKIDYKNKKIVNSWGTPSNSSHGSTEYYINTNYHNYLTEKKNIIIEQTNGVEKTTTTISKFEYGEITNFQKNVEVKDIDY